MDSIQTPLIILRDNQAVVKYVQMITSPMTIITLIWSNHWLCG